MITNEIPPTTYDFGHAMANFAAEHLLSVKTRAVIESGDEHFQPAVAVFRNEEFITWVIADKMDRDKGLAACHGAINGFAADEIVVGFDARMMITGSEEELHKIQPGDLQRMAEEEGSDIFGVTIECLMVHHYKDGWSQIGMYPYLTIKDDQGKPGIQWLDDKFDQMRSDDERGAMTGFIPRVIQELFDDAKDKPDLVSLGVEAMGMSHFESRMHVDCAIIKVLTDQDFVVLYNADTDAKREILKASMEGGALKGMDMQFGFGGDVDDNGHLDPKGES
jgi:hypothetical protein